MSTPLSGEGFYQQVLDTYTALLAENARLRSICEAVAEETIEYLNVGTPGASGGLVPEEPSLDEAVRRMKVSLRTKCERLRGLQERMDAQYTADMTDMLNENANLTAQLAAMTHDRDEWHRDASSHLSALCEKHTEINGLENQLAASEAREKEEK